MFRPLSILLLLSCFLAASGQTDSVRKWLDADLQFTTRSKAVFAAMAFREHDRWLLYAVYPDTTPLLKIYYKNAALTVKDGPFTLYHRKNRPAQRGAFVNNRPDGLWQTWYQNGQLKNEGTVTRNRLSGVWKWWYEDGKPKSELTYSDAAQIPDYDGSSQYNPAENNEGILGTVLPDGTLNGSCTNWYSNGNRESELNYRNDSLTGNCSWYRETGLPSSRETYVNGKVTALLCYDENGQLTGSTCSILKLPVLIHPVFSALDYIEAELHKERRRDIKSEGVASVQFTVTKKGTVENLVIVESPDEALSKHIRLIFAGMPAWSPAVTHNRAVDYPVKLEIPWFNN